MAETGLLQSFLAAVQASLSVLLVMLYGGVAAHFRMIDRANTKAISKICVRMFLPALLITKLGAELRAESAPRYVSILVWAVACHVVSFLFGLLGRVGLGMPDWVTVAILINNTTSYPLLLVTALEDTGILNPLLGANESARGAIERAKSYFLVFSTVSNCITFAVGPRLIDSEHAPDDDQQEGKADNAADGADHEHSPAVDVEAANEETRLLDSHLPNSVHSPAPVRRNSFLLPSRPKQDKPDHRRPWFVPHKRWHRLSPRAKWWLLFAVDFFNTPLLGAIIGVIIGMVPAFHRAFFNGSDDGGIFTAWLTASLKTIGGLFVSLPVVVAGVTLFCSTREARRNNERIMSNLPWATVGYILFVRFIAWPALSIGVIYMLATRTTLLGSDPVLWFCLMMMPAGPSAMKLITLVQVAEGSKDDESHISRLLTISYIISPVLSLTVAGSLLASQSAIQR
ncbi:auxin efflux carrier [Achaetomium macrosporum]|uniref:Auxin efflux carrier n=1 Tax=Achaetomium macrosporum TaxID=79813 RepID=A0AAN7CB19_9PEZI|nr:auxin efflux carrier [Achaetomium macrosporum]